MKPQQQEEKTDIIIYLSGLAEMAYRLGRNTESPDHKLYDSWEMNSIQYIHSHITPFIKNSNISLKAAHQLAVKELKADGWKHGEVDDLANAISTMMMPYDQLSEHDLTKLLFWKSLVFNLEKFYNGFRNKLESDIMNALQTDQAISLINTMETVVN